MNKFIKFAHIIVLLLLIGCKPNIADLKSYKVTITTPYGNIHKEKIIYSTSSPTIHSDEDGVLYFDWDGNRWRTNKVPVGWLVEIESVPEKE